jgi:hypothetical protein
MIWINLLIYLLAGLLGLQLFRSLLRRFFAQASEKSFDFAFLVLLILGAIILIFDDQLKKSTEVAFKESVKVAETKSLKIEAKASQAEQRAGQADQRAAQAEQSLKVAEKEISELQKSLAKSHAELELVKKRTAARSITPEVRAKMIPTLSKLKGGQIKISCLMGDGEGCNFAGQLKEIFVASGWKVNGVSQVVYSKPFLKMRIFFGGEKPSQVVTFIANLLDSFGFDIGDNLYRNKDQPPEMVSLFIGGKE